MKADALALEAEAYEHIAKGYELLAAAKRLAAGPPVVTEEQEWISPSKSPLGKRTTLGLCRSGAIESTKVGRKILVKRASLEVFLAKRRRHVDVDDEDLFGSTGA